jgi:hypothetical protein
MKEHINLSMENNGYDGYPLRVEVLSKTYDPDNGIAGGEPGVYLQFVEGCGYDVRVLSVIEAEALASILKHVAAESRKSFSEKDNQLELNNNE